MTWLAYRLNQRVQVLKPVHVPGDDGKLELGFGGVNDATEMTPLLTLWMEVVPIGVKGTGRRYVRGEQTGENVTHEFTVRELEVAVLGREVSTAFSTAFKVMSDLSPLKSDYFLFFQKGSAIKGRLFRIKDFANIDECDEYLNIGAEEVEERGTGYGI